MGFNAWIRKIPWRRAWQPIPVFLPGKLHGQRSLAGYSVWGCTELDSIEQHTHTTHIYTHTTHIPHHTHTTPHTYHTTHTHTLTLFRKPLHTHTPHHTYTTPHPHTHPTHTYTPYIHPTPHFTHIPPHTPHTHTHTHTPVQEASPDYSRPSCAPLAPRWEKEAAGEGGVTF